MREVPPIAWRAVLIGGSVALAVSLFLSMASQMLPAVAVGIAAGAAVAGRLARERSGFHGGLVAVLWIGAEALSEPFRPAPADVVADLAQTILLDVVRLALGVLFGWLGGLARR
ncbi:MAG: hypothetical protein HYY42_04720 [Chloroflexi bacterium]|nr:hypothetical protein [Chloroflexota bacterium]